MTSAAETVRRLREKREFFDRLAGGWHRENRLSARTRDLLLESLPPGFLELPGPVIDLGGGTGRVAEFFRRMTAAPLLVFDLSRRMLRETPRIRAGRLQGDAHHLPLRDRSVRLVCCFSAFPHFERQLEVIRECRRVLEPGGFLVILHECGREEINRFHSSQSPVIAGDHLPSLEEFRQWGEMAGMTPDRLEDGEDRFLVRYRKPLTER